MVLLLQGGVEISRFMVNALARAAVGDKSKGCSRTYRASQAFSKSIIHNIADAQVPLGCPELCLPQEIIIDNEGGSHMYEHTYAQDSRQFWVIDPSNWRLQSETTEGND